MLKNQSLEYARIKHMETPENNPALHLDEEQLFLLLPAWEKEVRRLLPALPLQVNVQFNNNWLIDVTGTGGFAHTRNNIELAFDFNFKGDKTKQLNDLRGSYYHECYHLVQNFTGDEFDDASTPLPAIDNAIYEGAATRFEAIRANSTPPWGEYDSKEVMIGWVEELRLLPPDYDWNRWKFYDEETGNRWIMYRTGSFIVDQALELNSDIEIEDLATLSPKKIFQLAKLA